MSGSTCSTQRSGSADITRRLVEICGPPFARPAGPADEVAGQAATWVAVPGDARAAAEVLRLAAAHDLTVVPRGAGTKIDWGAAPDRVDIMLDTGRIAGIRHPSEPDRHGAAGLGRHRRAEAGSADRSGAGSSDPGRADVGRPGPRRSGGPGPAGRSRAEPPAGWSWVDPPAERSPAEPAVGWSRVEPPAGRSSAERHGHPVVEIGAGTPLRAVQAALARSGRRLALDAPSPGATLGGVLAADESGPLRLRYGTPCDQLVDLRYLTADGDLVDAAGGASGLETARLLCGSQGGLGVLVSATLRTQPLPAARAWVTRPVWTPLEVHELIQAVLAAGLQPAAIELDLPTARRPPAPRGAADSAPPTGAGWSGHPAGSARAAHPAGSARAAHPAGSARTGRSTGSARSTPPAAGDLVVLLEGGPAEVAERTRRLTGLLGDTATVADSPPDWWRRYPFRPDDIALRVDVPLTDLHAAIYALRDAVGAPVPVRGSVGLGVAHAVLPGNTRVDRVASILTAVRQVLLARQGRCVVLAAPPAVRQGVDLWGELPALPRLLAAKRYLDPHQRLAPGRLPGGL
ncbi:FAD-binding oxidoreductase [Micromonospora cathayae]|uniref:FAD-binding oxidoreductase n=1 Tax=Micromonospora cathayae TaxID=3028804 RepID=A0ABY7ZWK1_9ACTN|nr:FAD-binding oxidoreductase [Micromonospora sp. HUAS 3]WDZ86279.1 FAD-binding oxidoreductase [Micromonospora sp. HUAS 3]